MTDIPVLAITADGQTQTTLAKALGDLTNQQAVKRAARKCDGCGRYQKPEDLTHIATADMDIKRICPDCMDDKSDEDPSKTWKSLKKAQWADAVDAIDDALDVSPTWSWYQRLDSATKAQASERLAKAHPWGEKHESAASRDRQLLARLESLAKAERTRNKTQRLEKKTEKSRAETMRKAEAVNAQLAGAEATLFKALEEHMDQAEGVWEFAKDARTRIDAMMARLEAGQRQARINAQAPLIAAQAREDRVRADYALAASQTNDPDLRRYYLAKAAGEDLGDD